MKPNRSRKEGDMGIKWLRVSVHTIHTFVSSYTHAFSIIPSQHILFIQPSSPPPPSPPPHPAHPLSAPTQASASNSYTPPAPLFLLISQNRTPSGLRALTSLIKHIACNKRNRNRNNSHCNLPRQRLVSRRQLLPP